MKDSFGGAIECALERGKAQAAEELCANKILTVPAADVPGYNANAYNGKVKVVGVSTHCSARARPGLPYFCDNARVDLGEAHGRRCRVKVRLLLET